MEYKVSRLSGKWYNENNIVVSLDTNTTSGMAVDLWLKQGNEPIIFEGTEEEIYQQKIEKAIDIDLDYTYRISKLMSKHNDKFIEGLINGIPYVIPQDVVDEKERLKAECNQLINDLGINDFSYRQENLQLKK